MFRYIFILVSILWLSQKSICFGESCENLIENLFLKIKTQESRYTPLDLFSNNKTAMKTFDKILTLAEEKNYNQSRVVTYLNDILQKNGRFSTSDPVHLTGSIYHDNSTLTINFDSVGRNPKINPYVKDIRYKRLYGLFWGIAQRVSKDESITNINININKQINPMLGELHKNLGFISTRDNFFIYYHLNLEL